METHIMNMNFKPLVFSIVALTFCSTAYSQGLSLGVVGVGSVQNPSFQSSGSQNTVKGKYGLGAGITSELVFVNGVAIEADLIFLNHKFSRDTAEFFGTTVSSTFTSNYVQIPVLLRFRPVPLVNLGLGAYYSRVVSSWSVSAASFENRTVDYGKDDFGFVTAVGTFIPASEILTLVADLRYTRSLSNSATSSATSTDSLKFSDLQFIVGLRIGIR